MLVAVSGENRESKWNSVAIHKKSHLDDRVWPVLFAFSVFFYSIRLLDLEVEVCTIIVKNAVISFSKEVTVFVNLRLDKVAFFTEDAERAVNIVQFICGLLQKLPRSPIRRILAGRIQYSSEDEIRKDRIEVKLVFMLRFYLAADSIKA